MAILRYLIIHSSATPEERAVKSDEIRRWHTAPISAGGRGWRQVGYTDMFHLDGRVERLVENNEDTLVDAFEVTNGAKGYNSIARHIVYVGGIDKITKKPKDTRTEAQRKAMAEYVIDFHKRFPNVKIIGHNEVAAKACPCFDVQKWLKEIGVTQ